MPNHKPDRHFLNLGRSYVTKISLLRPVRVWLNSMWTVLLYAVETWTLKEAYINKLEAVEMGLLRRMLRMSWVDRMRNDNARFLYYFAFTTCESEF